jgi:hypothetical protein
MAERGLIDVACRHAEWRNGGKKGWFLPLRDGARKLIQQGPIVCKNYYN